MKARTTRDIGPAVTPVDWERVRGGRPFSTADMDQEAINRHCSPLPTPERVENSGRARALLESRGEKMYPHGPWEVVADRTGQVWLMRVEYRERADMKQFKRRDTSGDPREQFGADLRGGKD